MSYYPGQLLRGVAQLITVFSFVFISQGSLAEEPAPVISDLTFTNNGLEMTFTNLSTGGNRMRQHAAFSRGYTHPRNCLSLSTWLTLCLDGVPLVVATTKRGSSIK